MKAEVSGVLENFNFTTRIRNQSEHQEAVALMELLIENYEHNRPLIDFLSVSINSWENKPEEFSGLNDAVASISVAIAALHELMNQNQMTNTGQYPTEEESPFLQSYLCLLDKNIQEMPENLRPLSQEFLSSIEDLVGDMEIDLDSVLTANND